MTKQELFNLMKGTIIVSCQATPGEPLYMKEQSIMYLMARTAKLAGAKMIRTSSVRDIRLAREKTGEISLEGREIYRRAAEGDSAMLEALDEWIDDIAAGITGLVHIFNPEVVLIGGGVSAQEDLMIEPLRRKVLSGVMPRFAEGLEVKRAALSNDAGLIGAARFFMGRQR